MKRKIISFIIGFLLIQAGYSQMIRVGLYNNEVVESLVVYCTSGDYLIKNGEERLGSFKKGDILFAVLSDGKINLYNASRIFGSFESFELESLSLGGTFRIRPVVPALDSRSYEDNLFISSKENFLGIINEVDFDKYIAGVLESEVGPNVHIELYKAHALMTRTYMLANFRKHMDEGFSLCDDVHCQAYHGRAMYNPEILKAVYETTGEVIADYHYKLINAVYHSNSGGETQRADDVWLKDIDYLQSVIDPYSLHQAHAKWYDTIYFDDWKKYLFENGMKSVKKIPDELLYVQQRHRKKYFILDQDSILMTKVREDWNLKSTFFNMFPEIGGRIVIWGKGYGHGVGLSQEGAINMAELDYNYKEILQFYYFNVRIMNYEDLPASSLPDFDF